MATLQRLRAQLQRPPFTSVEDIHTFMETGIPSPSTTFRISLCVDSVCQFADGLHINLIDEDLAQQLQEFDDLDKQLAKVQQASLRFQLTVWNPRGQHLTPGMFTLPRGTVVAMNQVTHLKKYGSQCQANIDVNQLQLYRANAAV